MNSQMPWGISCMPHRSAFLRGCRIRPARPARSALPTGSRLGSPADRGCCRARRRRRRRCGRRAWSASHLPQVPSGLRSQRSTMSSARSVPGSRCAAHRLESWQLPLVAAARRGFDRRQCPRSPAAPAPLPGGCPCGLVARAGDFAMSLRPIRGVPAPSRARRGQQGDNHRPIVAFRAGSGREPAIRAPWPHLGSTCHSPLSRRAKQRNGWRVGTC